METTMDSVDFEARCLDLLDDIAKGRILRVTITLRGRPVAVIGPPPAETRVRSLHGFMAGLVDLPDDLDLTAPTLDAPWDPVHPPTQT